MTYKISGEPAPFSDGIRHDPSSRNEAYSPSTSGDSFFGDAAPAGPCRA